MHTFEHVYYHQQQALHGYVAVDKENLTLKPAVLVVHDWSGRNAFVCDKADELATRGYVGFAVDMYGEGRIGNTIDEKQVLMQPLVSDRALLRARIMAAYHAILDMDGVDKQRIAIIGFCFGGLCALDLARAGADIVGAVSFHGSLHKPVHLPSHRVKAKVLVLHGYNDPMIKPNDVATFCDEMTQAHVDWQVHMYGNTQHAFTNPLAHDKQLGLVYQEQIARRAYQSMYNFFDEIFA